MCVDRTKWNFGNTVEFAWLALKQVSHLYIGSACISSWIKTPGLQTNQGTNFETVGEAKFHCSLETSDTPLNIKTLRVHIATFHITHFLYTRNFYKGVGVILLLFAVIHGALNLFSSSLEATEAPHTHGHST